MMKIRRNSPAGASVCWRKYTVLVWRFILVPLTLFVAIHSSFDSASLETKFFVNVDSAAFQIDGSRQSANLTLGPMHLGELPLSIQSQFADYGLELNYWDTSR